MSKFEKFYSNELEPYEQDVDNYNELIETWVSYRDKEDGLLQSLSLAMSGNGGASIAEAISNVQMAKQEYVEDLIDVSEVIFDTIERDEAVTIWANVIHQTLRARLDLMQFISPETSFDIPPLSELETNGYAYGAGRDRARADGILDAEQAYAKSQPDQSGPYEQIGIERLHEILEDDDIEWDNLSSVSEGDEYAEWVLDELCENLENYVDDLLESIPENLYPDN